MSTITPLLSLLQPPYGWILLLVLALPFWVLFLGLFLQRFDAINRGSLSLMKEIGRGLTRKERDLSRYAAALTASWLLILVFKVYQQYFTGAPLPHTSLGAFDLSLGLFSLASWAGMLILRTQERL